ncbi:Nitroreductase [Filimonas lacunae]|uniref:Nitroreductase n=1 Tax=Filimonas lacunae TaxID=477680 RepID=A0A173M9Q1_9BACT|nr:nitroreductase family protein [Filimonas lacunae]BAV04240.1 nitroreductase [Filimonas lacunae]SIT13715.1 Nitroreductase [Filimonas lacunae]
MSLLTDLQWRYATKKMNGQAVSQDKVDYILEAASLAPTSSGLQPFEIFVITNKELLQQIHPIAYGQQQVLDASHVLVFASWDKYTEERVNGYFKFLNAERGVPDSATDDYRNRLLGMFGAMSEEDQAAHAAKQAYIAFGVAIAAAAEQKVDATPMEGFVKADLDKLLNLDAKGLKSATILPLGYRDEANDWLVNLKKVRRPKHQFINEIK